MTRVDMRLVHEIHMECVADPRLMDLVDDETLALFEYDYLAKLRPAQNYAEHFKAVDQIANFSGRGTGKSFADTCYALDYVLHDSKPGEQGMIVAPTHTDWQTIAKGPNSFRAIAPPCVPIEVVSSSGNESIRFPEQQFEIVFRTGEAFERARGFNGSFVIFSEFCANNPAKYQDIYDVVTMGIRVGGSKILISTTPKPGKLIKDFERDPDTKLVRESTYVNAANLSPAMLKRAKKLEGTLRGRQEIYGEVLDLGNAVMFDDSFLVREPAFDWRDCAWIGVSIDPSNSAKKNSDECGIIVFGVQLREVIPCVTCRSTEWVDSRIRGRIRCPTCANLPRRPQRMIVLEDLSGRHNPARVVSLVDQVWAKYGAKLRMVIYETNSGGHWTGNVLGKFEQLLVEEHATVAKRTRIENVNPFWQSRQIVMAGEFPELEEQLDNFVAGSTDDRVDALSQGAHYAFSEVTVECRQNVSIV